LNLAITETNFVDKAFVDNTSPVINDVSISLNEEQTSFSANILGEDKGTTYKYYVNKPKVDENDVEKMSNIISQEAKAGIKGYVIDVNTNQNAMPELIEYEKDKITVKNVVSLSDEGTYTKDLESLPEGENYYLHVYAVDNNNNVSEEVIKKITQIIKLIRSKGISVFFISQSPTDIPNEILGQLGNRVQHCLRAYTPQELKAVKTAASTLRENPELDTEKAILELGTGEALVSFVNE